MGSEISFSDEAQALYSTALEKIADARTHALRAECAYLEEEMDQYNHGRILSPPEQFRLNQLQSHYNYLKGRAESIRSAVLDDGSCSLDDAEI